MLTPYEAAVHQEEVTLTFPALVELHLVTRTPGAEVAVDALSGAPLDVTASAQESETDTVYRIRCAILWYDPAGQALLGALPAGVVVGHLLLRTRPAYQDLLWQVYRSLPSYLLVDGRKVRPRDIQVARVEQVTSLEVRCDLTNPEVR